MSLLEICKENGHVYSTGVALNQRTGEEEAPHEWCGFGRY